MAVSVEVLWHKFNYSNRLGKQKARQTTKKSLPLALANGIMNKKRPGFSPNYRHALY
jgi:hypothetical protein